MKSNHSIFKVTFLLFAFSGLMATAVAFGAPSRTNNGLVKASPYKRNISSLTSEVTTLNPDDYTSISSAELSPKIFSYTGTSLSRHLNVQFESKVISALSPNTKDVFYVVDDARYTGDRMDPFNVEVPDKTLNGFTYTARANDTQTKMYFSNTISYGSKFIVKNSKIASNCMYQTVERDVSTGLDVLTYDAYKNLETIYICDGIETIESSAFVNVPATVAIKCVAASKPAGWADDWTDAAASQIQWGAALDDASKSDVKHSGSTKSFGDASDYILGYKGNSDVLFDAYPLTISYEKTTASGEKVIEYQTIPTKHQTNPYDAVGSKIYAATNSFEVTINVNKGEVIDENSYKFYNIFNAQRYYIEKKVAWPTDEIQKVFDAYSVPTKSEDGSKSFIPTLEGDSYFYQPFELGTDRYLTIARDFETEAEADALIDQYRNSITSFEASKDVFSTKEDLKYTHIPDYEDSLYGEVYKLLYEYEKGDTKIRTHIYVQFYKYLNESNNKYEFVTYIVLDNPTDELNEEGNATGKLLDSMSPFPIVKKTDAIRPFIFVPEYVEEKDSSGNVISRKPKQMHSAAAIARFSKMINFTDILTTEYKSSSKFLSYSSVGMKVDKVIGTAYAAYLKNDEGVFDENSGLKALTLGEDGKYYHGATAYEKADVKVVEEFDAPLLYIEDNSSRSKVETNLNAILAGDIRFRCTLTGLNNASLIVSYRKGNEILQKELPIVSPSPVIEIDKDYDNQISFLLDNSSLDDVDTKDILAVGVSGMTVNVHLYNTTSRTVVQNTQLNNIFGNVEILPYSENELKFFDINVYLLVFYVALLLGYALVAVVLFFYKKNKYKNDEFRRMKPKAYLKSAILGFVGLAIISAAINFIVLRFGVFYSTVPTFNPIDPFVIAFGIFGAISVGVFIKNLIAAIKTMKKLKEIKKLHLDADVADDGTN